MTFGRRILRADDGAIMLIALFFAIFAVAILYLAVGAGQSVLFREHLQDSADAAALSGAITYARLMNVLVLINLVMAALVAILLTLKLVEGLAIFGIALAAALAFFTGGSSLSAVPPLNALRANMKDLYAALKPDIFQILENLHDVSDKVVEVAPYAVEAVALSEIYGSSQKVANAGFVAQTVESLPVEDDSYAKLCENAGTLVEKIAAKPFEGIPGLDDVVGAMLSPISDLSYAMSQWFCGDGGTNMPDLSREVDRGYPQPENAADCTGQEIHDVPRGQESKTTSDACDKVEARRAAAEPDDQGYCKTDCGIDGPYEQAIKQARNDCNPVVDPRPSKYRYQLQKVRVWYTWNGSMWVKGPPQIVSSEVVVASAPPCGSSNVHPTLAEGYNLVVHPRDAPTQIQNVCSAEDPPALPTPESQEKTERTFHPPPVSYDYEQVPQIFSCMRKSRTVVAQKDEQESKSGPANKKSPKKVMPKTHLGDESFQLRAVAFGNAEQAESARLVRLGLHGKGDPENPFDRLKYLGGFSLAQAEYYYSLPVDRDAWMWNMSWRARLKRFDLTDDASATDNSDKSRNQGDPRTAFASACAVHVSPLLCGRMLVFVELLKDSIAH